MAKSIIFIVTDIYSGGGGEHVASNIASALAEKYEVELLSLFKSTNSVPFPISERVSLKFLNVSTRNVIGKIKASYRLNRYLSVHHRDIALGIGTLSNILLSISRKKVGYTIGCEHSAYNALPYKWRILRSLFYPKLSRIVLLTEQDRKRMYPINHNLSVIQNAISIKPSKRSSIDNPVFIAIGRLYHIKQFDLMINAFASYCSRGGKWNLNIIGEGPDRQVLSDLILKQKLNERVKLKPFTLDVESEYLSASCCLLTSKTEGLPMVLIEAQSYGLPIISFDCQTGPSDIIENNKDGFLIPVGDVDGFVSKMLEVSSDRKLRKQMSDNAIINSKRFLPENVNKKWFSLLSNIK